jgi:hypothetical protein
VGSAHGFHEVCLRSPGRYDVSNSFSDFAPEHLRPIEDVMARVLGDDYAHAFCGVVYSEPGSSDQQWHADSLHLYENHGDANLINGLVALHDISYDLGPTEFAPCSHLLTNHLTNPLVDGTNIVYQTPANLNEPGLIGANPEHNLCLELPAGSVVLFDDRTLHRGRGNVSTEGTSRYVGYFSFRRPWYNPDTHFEATRSLYDVEENGGVVFGNEADGDRHRTGASDGSGSGNLKVNGGENDDQAAAPLSFDLAASVRPEFPALGDYAPAIFADGAGGSQLPQSVIDAVSTQMRRGVANLGGYYPTSELCLESAREARRAMSDFLHCGADEVVFGANMTNLVYHLGHALFQSPTCMPAGSNIVLSRLEHDANAGPWERLAQEIGRNVEVRWIPLDPENEGHLDLSRLEELVDDNTSFVAVGAASNALGTINDIEVRLWSRFLLGVFGLFLYVCVCVGNPPPSPHSPLSSLV